MDNIFWIVITDLDGTLLDHFTYSMKPAEETIRRLSAEGIPVVFSSSKTRIEMESMVKDSRLDTPFVFENGAAVVFKKKGILKVFGVKRDEIIASLNLMRSDLDIDVKAFSDMDARELSFLTGLTPLQAKMALQREYSEPFTLLDSNKKNDQDMRRWATAHGLRLLKGGRFYHLQGMHDKGTAVDYLRDFYKIYSGDRTLQVLALGDSHNDFDMLYKADKPVLVKRHDGTHARWDRDNDVYFTEAKGPCGWKEAVERIIFQGP